jgi:hypothetical protein
MRFRGINYTNGSKRATFVNLHVHSPILYILSHSHIVLPFPLREDHNRVAFGISLLLRTLLTKTLGKFTECFLRLLQTEQQNKFTCI